MNSKKLCSCGCKTDISHLPQKHEFSQRQYLNLYHCIQHQRFMRWKRYRQQSIQRREHRS